ncbi:MAG: maltose alpha-D-glucosyltransferase [Thermodesulfobacteriota bacterium]
MPRTPSTLISDPLWFKDALVYEVHVRAFCDSDGDGIGDFPGLTSKLDYLKDLGVTALWLLPFFPSPLRDDGYDTADYLGVHPAYGALADFRKFLRAAHARGIRVITELVLNHTSDAHHWFQRARRAKPGSVHRDFYVWSDTPDRYAEARIIFKDFESSNWAWDPVAQAYYWHRFYSHQPDLNYENPRVREAMFKVLDYWFEMGVDGMRLDAVPYLFEEEGTNCENLPQTLDFLRELRAHIEARHADKMLLAEANQWPEDTAAYFGAGDMCHMAFHFPTMPRLFMSLRMEDRFPLVDILEQTPAIPETCQWAQFLRNHDELTLEMVTDEERVFMYREYAHDPKMRINLGIRRRFAPLMGNNRRTMELLNALLFSLPGTPVLYYGDEIGMGDNIYLGDRNGVRTPMQWSGDKNAGFSDANPQSLFLPVIIDPEYHYQSVNVEAQTGNPHSLLWWMKRLIALRKRHAAFSRGEIRFLDPDNRRILAFVRRRGDEHILVVANLSRFSQPVELDLAEHAGASPVELFGKTEFPAVGASPYSLTMGPHTFFWFILKRPETAGDRDERELPLVTTPGAWEDILGETMRPNLEATLQAWLTGRPWFNPGGHAFKSVTVREVLRLSDNGLAAHVVLADAFFADAEAETYALPLAYAGKDDYDAILRNAPQAGVARMRVTEPREIGLLYDAMFSERFCRALLAAVPRQGPASGAAGDLTGLRTTLFRTQVQAAGSGVLSPSARSDQSNSMVTFGESLALKFFRRLEPETNPELELGRHLAGRGAGFTPRILGAIEYRRGRSTPMTLAVLQERIKHHGSAWELALDAVQALGEEIMAERIPPPPLAGHLLDLEEALPAVLAKSTGGFISAMRRLGRRLAELHAALADSTDPAFAPEPFSRLYRRSMAQAFRSQAGMALRLLKARLPDLDPALRGQALFALDHAAAIKDYSRSLVDRELTGWRIRCHGHFHLGHALLLPDQEFALIDFEGDPTRPLAERRIKRSPLRDAASLVRSLHHAAQAALDNLTERGICRPEDLALARLWTRSWRTHAARAFLRAHLENLPPGLLPEDPGDVRLLLDAFLLDRAVVELGQVLARRPESLLAPLSGIREIVEEGKD